MSRRRLTVIPDTPEQDEDWNVDPVDSDLDEEVWNMVAAQLQRTAGATAIQQIIEKLEGRERDDGLKLRRPEIKWALYRLYLMGLVRFESHGVKPSWTNAQKSLALRGMDRPQHVTYLTHVQLAAPDRFIPSNLKRREWYAFGPVPDKPMKPKLPHKNWKGSALQWVKQGAPLTVAYGAGVDSTAMLVEFVRKGIRPDLILFADVGAEKPETYDYIEVMNAYLRQHEFPPVVVVRYEMTEGGKRARKTIAADESRKALDPRAYRTITENCEFNRTLPSLAFGFQSHACSSKWKVNPQEAYITTGPFSAQARAAWKQGLPVIRAIGFDASSGDRGRRDRIPDTVHFLHWYPLQDWDWDRERCKEEILKAGLPLPLKSACFFCPSTDPLEIQRFVLQRSPMAGTIRRIEDLARPYNKKGKHQGLWFVGDKLPESIRSAHPMHHEYWFENGKVTPKEADFFIQVKWGGLPEYRREKGSTGNIGKYSTKPGRMSDFMEVFERFCQQRPGHPECNLASVEAAIDSAGATPNPAATSADAAITYGMANPTEGTPPMHSARREGDPPDNHKYVTQDAKVGLEVWMAKTPPTQFTYDMGEYGVAYRIIKASPNRVVVQRVGSKVKRTYSWDGYFYTRWRRSDERGVKRFPQTLVYDADAVQGGSATALTPAKKAMKLGTIQRLVLENVRDHGDPFHGGGREYNERWRREPVLSALRKRGWVEDWHDHFPDVHFAGLPGYEHPDYVQDFYLTDAGRQALKAAGLPELPPEPPRLKRLAKELNELWVPEPLGVRSVGTGYGRWGWSLFVYCDDPEDARNFLPAGIAGFRIELRGVPHKLASAGLAKPNPAAATVRIKVDPEETKAERKRHQERRLVVGTFASLISLYRVLDGAELRNVAAGAPFGGYFATETERSYGSSWGADFDEVVKFGSNWSRHGRLGPELFVAQIEGNGRRFAHLGSDHLQLKAEPYEIPTSVCSTGLGCSIPVRAVDVERWWRIDAKGRPVPATWKELQKLAPTVGGETRQREVWLGAMTRPPKAVADRLRYDLRAAHIKRTVQDSRQQGDALWRLSMTAKGRELSLTAIMKVMCSAGCSRWLSSAGTAEAQARPAESDPERGLFSIIVRGVAKTAIDPGFGASPGKVKVDRALLYDPSVGDWKELDVGTYKGKMFDLRKLSP